jgi:DNA topoisomerase II
MPKKASQKSLSESSVLESEKTEYSALEPHEHVLKRPSMYIGGIVPVKMDFYSASNIDEGIKIVKKEGMINQGLHRIFVEILSNAIDNVWRSSKSSTPCTSIKVDINRETGEISVWNNGKTIPVEINPETGLYNPEMLFGRLLSGSNFNDNEERMSSGTNGLGSVVANIFSTAFEVDIFDNHTLKKYVQTWTENMKNVGKPTITTPKTKAGYVKVTFLPDFEKFGCTGLSDDMYSLFYKNVVDTAMLTGVNVFFNGTKIPMKTLKDYASLYMLPIVQPEAVEAVEEKDKKDEEEEDDEKGGDDDAVSVTSTASKTGKEKSKSRKKQLDQIHIISDDSECVLQSNPNIVDGFQFIAFVNGIETRDGGSHVDTYAEAIFRPLLEALNKGVKKGSTPLGLKEIKPYFQMFLKSTLDKPAFNSQEKSKLVSPAPAVPEVTTKHINAILKWGCVDKIKNLLKGKELVALKKTEKKRGFVKIEGYDPANLAGGKNSKECSLILTEGLSAKTFCVLGLSQELFGKKGRDYVGIFPLKGKVLNVRNSSVTQISGNKEICNLIKILNLRFGVDYTKDEEFNTLSYGRLVGLSDQDADGKHILSLLLNMFHKLFPSLMERKVPFIYCMLTPLIKIYDKKTELSFYNIQDYKEYLEKNGGRIKGDIKYLKGLGSSSNADVKSSFGKKMIEFVKDEKTDDMMDKCFLTKHSDRRKEWIAQYDPVKNNLKLGKHAFEKVSISEYLDKELIIFSVDDCRRSIASISDGLKQSQRKVLYSIFLKNLSYNGKSLKVAQLGAFCAEKTSYHHGEVSLFETIIRMAQDFIGSNNIPFLFRDGQFGSLSMLGEDAASPRYIHTRMDRFTRLLFRKEDDALLNYLEDDGESIEPQEFAPILPTILINGSLGIGSGYSSTIPLYNPKDVLACVREWLKQKCYSEAVVPVFPEIHPWYRGFNGTIEKVEKDKHRYITKGVLARGKGDVVTVSVIPVNMSIDSFKSSLDDLLEAKKIKSYKNFSTDNVPHFEIKENSAELELTIESLKLTSTISTSNMVLFDTAQKLKKYETVSEILNEFCHFRYGFYVKRKLYLIKTIENELLVLKNKFRFLTEVMDETLVIQDVDESDIVKTLKKTGYVCVDGDEEFKYLLNMQIRSFSKQKLEELKKAIEKLDAELKHVRKISEAEMWEHDLGEFEKEFKA